MANSPAAVASRPNWNQLYYTPSPEWDEVEKVRRVIVGALSLVGGLSLFSAGFSATSSSNWFPTFLMIGVAVASFEVARRYLAPSLNDPEVALRFRQQVGLDIDSPDMTYVKFFQKYQELINYNRWILGLDDIVPLLERDIEQLDYTAFMKKHSEGNVDIKRAIADRVSSNVRQKLCLSCRVEYALHPWEADETDKWLLQANTFDPNLEIRSAKNWEECYKIFHRNPAAITDPRAHEALISLFVEARFNEITDKQSWGGIHYYLQELPEDCQKSIQEILVPFELELFAEGNLSFQKLVWAKNWEVIVAYLSRVNPSKLEKLKQELRQVCLASKSISALPQEMIKILEITPKMIEEEHSTIVDECMKLDYLGEGGFREKYGSKYLNNGILQDVQLNKIKAELRLTLKDVSSRGLRVFFEELEILGLRSEILAQLWEKMSFQAITEDGFELSIFFEHAEKVLGVERAKAKTIEGIQKLTCFQLLDLWHLFRERAPTLDAVYPDARNEVENAGHELYDELRELGNKYRDSQKSKQIQNLEKSLQKIQHDTYCLNSDNQRLFTQLRDKENEVKRTQEELLFIHQRLQGLPLLQERLQKQLDALERATLQNSLSELTAQLQPARKALRDLEKAQPTGEALEKARKDLNTLEKNQLTILADIEARNQEFVVLNKKIEAIASEIEMGPTATQSLEQLLSSQQKQLADIEKQAQAPTQQKLKLEEKRLAVEKEKLELENEVLRLQKEEEQERKQVNDKYVKLIRSHFEQLVSILFQPPEMKT